MKTIFTKIKIWYWKWIKGWCRARACCKCDYKAMCWEHIDEVWESKQK